MALKELHFKKASLQCQPGTALSPAIQEQGFTYNSGMWQNQVFSLSEICIAQESPEYRPKISFGQNP